MRCLVPLVFLIVAGCASRPLSPSEEAFADTIMGPALATEDVRLVKGAVVGLLPVTVTPRPQTTCREKLFPPLTKPIQGQFPAFARRQTVYYSRPFWSEDFLREYPEKIDLDQAMRLAHELTHVWQWQERRRNGYSPFAAAWEHVGPGDPYLIDIDENLAFSDYAWEQQGSIVEEFVCCRALDPEGARTEKLTQLVAQVFPAAARRSSVANGGVVVPWKGVETEGICS